MSSYLLQNYCICLMNSEKCFWNSVKISRASQNRLKITATKHFSKNNSVHLEILRKCVWSLQKWRKCILRIMRRTKTVSDITYFFRSRSSAAFWRLLCRRSCDRNSIWFPKIENTISGFWNLAEKNFFCSSTQHFSNKKGKIIQPEKNSDYQSSRAQYLQLWQIYLEKIRSQISF